MSYFSQSEESAVSPSDQWTFVDLTVSKEQLETASSPEGPEMTQTFGVTPKESGPTSEVQTVRASLFENVVERHSVLMVDEAKAVNKFKDLPSSPSFKRESSEDEGTLVTALFKDSIAPSSPLRVVHAFDTVQAVEENRAVSENVPPAHWEDKAMTLRSRRSEGSKVVAEMTGSAHREPASAETPEQHPRYLRVRALQKWTTTGFDQDADMEKGMLRESQREVVLDKDREKQKEAEQEEVAEAPIRLKRLHAEEQPKPKATYFALTAQIQEPVSPVDTGANKGGMTSPFDDFSVTTLLGSSQGKILPVKRNPSLDEAFGKTNKSQDQAEESMRRSHMSHKEFRLVSDGQITEEMMEVEMNREAKMKAVEREKQRQLEQKQAHLEFARMKEREMQREFERQRQKAFEKENQEKQRALERQKQIELEKQKLLEMKREKEKELERERQQRLEQEKKLQLERQREKVYKQERERQERQRQREEERQRELDKDRHLLEIQKEKQKLEELERIKELERQQLLDFENQKKKEKEMQQALELEKQRLREKMEREEAEKMTQMALEQEMLRLKELDREKERQREMEKERQKELEWEKRRELERQRQKDLERERQRQLDMERQELETQRLRQLELEKERHRKEELERIKEMERQQLLEFEKQKQAERERQQILELERRRLRERMEREEAEKIRPIAKQQEAERQCLKEVQKKEEQERAKLESSPLRPKVVDLDSVLRNDQLSKATPQRSDPATRWKEPSPRAEESYKPAILDIDSLTSQTQLSPSKDLFSVSSIKGVDAGFGSRLQPSPERDVIWKVPPQTSGSFSNPVWTTSPQDPWELWPNEMCVDKPMAEPRKHANKVSLEQLLLRQDERQLAPQKQWSTVMDEPLLLAPFNQTKAGSPPGGVSSSVLAEPIWFPREPQCQDGRGEIQRPRRLQGSQVSDK